MLLMQHEKLYDKLYTRILSVNLVINHLGYLILPSFISLLH